MVTTSELNQKFQTVVEGPLGPRSKTQIVNRLLETIDHLRGEGHSFALIADSINNIMVPRKTPFSADELRGLFHRLKQRQLRAKSEADAIGPRSVPAAEPLTMAAADQKFDLKHKIEPDAQSTVERARHKLRPAKALKEI
jgi:hypothetical protein